MRTRLASIDIARGFAILWVIAYHTWTDLRFPNVYPIQADAFREVPRQLADADLPGAIAAAGEAFMRVGYLGVPLFMLLSGYSLTLSAMTRESAPRLEASRLPRRLRRLLVPYWAGFALTVAFACALAFVQWQRHGGTPYSDYLRDGDINLHADQLIAGILIFPRILQDKWQFAPQGSLWFVLVVVQYYLLFPLLLAALLRFGPRLFATASLVITLVSLAAMIAINGDLVQHRSWIEMAVPFRVFEFGAGMALAHLLANPDGAAPLLRNAAITATIIIAGLVTFVAGCLIAPNEGYAAVLQWPLIVAGLALMVAPLLATSAGALQSALPVRTLAWVGVVSYTVLIMNEPLRSITHTMRAEGAPTVWLTLWVVAGLLPLTFIFARPLARVLALEPKETSPRLYP